MVKVISLGKQLRCVLAPAQAWAWCQHAPGLTPGWKRDRESTLGCRGPGLTQAQRQSPLSPGRVTAPHGSQPRSVQALLLGQVGEVTPRAERLPGKGEKTRATGEGPWGEARTLNSGWVSVSW